MIKMNIPVIFQFLKDLSANNNREWFNEHKAEYETARVEFDNFLATVIARISLFDETIRGFSPKTVLIVFTGIPASLRIKHLIKYISEVISMPKERSPIIVDIMYTCSRMVLCLPEEACVCLPIS